MHLDMQMNEETSNYIRFGPRYNAECATVSSDQAWRKLRCRYVQ